MGGHAVDGIYWKLAMELLCVITYQVQQNGKHYRLSTNRMKIKFHARQDLDQRSEKIDSQEEIPPLIFYIIFLLAADLFGWRQSFKAITVNELALRPLRILLCDLCVNPFRAIFYFCFFGVVSIT